MTASTASSDGQPLLVKHEVLQQAPTGFLESELQASFDEAHAQSVRAAMRRLAAVFNFDLSTSTGAVDAPELHVDVVAGFDSRDIDTSAMVRRSLEAASGVGSRAVLLASDTAIELDRPDARDYQLDPLLPGSVFVRLNEGWQLCVSDPRGLDSQLQCIVDDLALASGAKTSMFYGLRGALGATPRRSTHRQLLIQLAGHRSVLAQSNSDQNQLQLRPGQAVLVPETWHITHLPRDEDTLHLEVSLAPTDEAEADRGTRAMLLVHTSPSYATARATVRTDPTQGWPFRLLAPGGVHVTRAGADSVTVAVGGRALTVSSRGVQALLKLAAGDYLTGQELAASTVCEPSESVSFCETLWGLGLLDPAPPPDQPQHDGERLTQVASTPEGDTALAAAMLELIDDDAWRAPREGEVHHGLDVDVSVQSLSLADNAEALAVPISMAVQMNAQFFELDVVGAVPHDPPLAVRVRPVGADRRAHAEGAGVLGSDLRSHPTRKLAFVVALTGADEGWIHLPAGSTTLRALAGSVAAWPALRPWLVGPADSGERLFLLARLHGPAFR